MGRASLTGVDLKLNRAFDHIHALSNAIDEFLRDPGAYGLVAKRYEDRVELRVEEAHKPPDHWGPVIGEIVYGLHSALDQLAFQLALANTRGRLPTRVETSSAFPIFNSGVKFRATDKKGRPAPNSGLRKIQAVSDVARTAIERVQPYHRRKNPRSLVLWQLHELSQIDKHRRLHLTYSSLEGSEFRLRTKDPIVFHGYSFLPGPLKTGAVVASWHFTRPEWSDSLNLQVDTEMISDITFGKSSPARSIRGRSVLKTLHDIGDFIATDVLPPLCEELGIESTFRPGHLYALGSLTREEAEEVSARGRKAEARRLQKKGLL